ncbi:hypothetical protein GO491_01515 [Flavobacteriaceae bacterium Ap0902]|nr:hypothetical protein [Flavobacteriaceae bacterium Ap0902]
MKYGLIITLILLFCACKNPFSNEKIENAPADYTIQNTEDGEILLRLKPNVGDKTNLKMEVNMKPEGMMISLDTHFVGDLKLRVTDTNEIENTYSVDFQRIQFDTSLLGTKISYDSQGENENIPRPLQEELERVLAKKVVMTLDSLAHVNTISFDQNQNDMASQSIDLNALFIPLPVKPVKVGDQWTATQEVQNIGDKELTYTIDKISDTEVLVLLTTSTDEVKGQYLIDRKTGFTKQGTLNIHSVENGKGLKMEIQLTSSPAL